jgi:hypothetical protein
MAGPYYEPQPPASPAAVERWSSASARRYVHTIFSVGAVKPIASIFSRLDTFAGRVPTWLLPVARDEDGNLFALSLREATVARSGSGRRVRGRRG